jgi:hypothetical protein
MEVKTPREAAMPSSIEDAVQFALIHVVESDDVHLAEQSDLVWFDVLRHLDWKHFLPIAVEYYEALWRFNQGQAQGRAQKAAACVANPETRKEATLRLLLERPTLDARKPLIETPPKPDLKPLHVNAADIRPGRVPVRIAGLRPKCFFAMFKAFVGMSLRGRACEPEVVDEELRSNPGFARTCGFTLRDDKRGYRQSDVPSLRKLEQFDQIMTDNGLWQKAAVEQVADNLKTGRLRIESTIVHDTTHYPAFSSMQAVEVPQQQQGPGRPKKPSRKSHPKTTKNCRCQDRRLCAHPWISADPGAGTVVKSGRQMHWAHKASTFGFAGQEVLLDAVAMTDAASHDSKSPLPHLERLFTLHPELVGKITRMLDDSAADDPKLKEVLVDKHHIELLCAPNPRGRKPMNEDLPRGIDHIRSTGTPVCAQGIPFDFLSCRHTTGHFVFRAPLGQDGKSVCAGCPMQSACCSHGGSRRQITLPFSRLPWIAPEFPQLSRRFQKAYARRTVIERIHKLMKYDFGDERLTKRGNKAFQARLDKTLLAMHLLVASP